MSRFRIVVVLTGALALGAFTLAFATLVRYGTAERSLGWNDVADGAERVIERVDSAGPAAGRVRVGDRLVSLNGDTLVARYGAGLYRITQPIGQSYTLRVERDGRQFEQTLTVAAGRTDLGYGVMLLVSLVWCAVGLFIGWARPDDAAARLAFAAALSTGFVYLQLMYFPGILPASMYQPLHMVLGYHFFFRFPGGVQRGRLSRALLPLFYAWGLIVCAIRQPINWIFFAHGAGAATAWRYQHLELLQLTGFAGITIMFPLIVGAVALVATTYRRLADAEKRRRIRWVVYASVVGLSPQVLWAAFALIGWIALPGPSPIPHGAQLAVDLSTNAGTVLIPIGVAYAVVKHRVFDIAVVVRRGVQYLLAKRALQVLLALPTIAIAVTVASQRDRTIEQILTENVVYLWLIAAAALSLRFRRPLIRWLDRRFFREQYNREQVLAGLLADLGGLGDPTDVARLVQAQVDYALHPSGVRLWFEGDPDPPPEQLLSFMAEGATPEEPITSREHLPGGISLVVPVISSEERVAGVLMLGGKRSEEPYSPNDLSLLRMVAKQAAVVRENLMLRERISEERRIRTDVLAHLEPDRVNLLKECPTCGSCYDSSAERCTHDGSELVLSLPVTRTVADRYRLDTLIGRGGMGAVYEAFDLRLERAVAIKFLLGQTFGHEHSLRRFRREAHAVARIHHPNIVSVYDYGGLEPHGAYLVMERIHGSTLRQELVQQGALSGAAAAEWFAPLLDGVAAAHEEGIVHRDLKPENVVRLRPEFGPQVVKILDFGIAKVRPVDTATETLTASGMIVGTFGYMSPEQLTGQDVDASSDIFAVGVMVVEALTGRLPFDGSTYGALLAAIVLEQYHLPGTTPQVLALDSLLQRCLAKEPQDRFASAAALRRELVPVLCECPALGPTPLR